MFLNKLPQCQLVWLLHKDKDISMSKYLIEFRDVDIKVMRIYLSIDGELFVDSVDVTDRNLFDINKTFNSALDC